LFDLSPDKIFFFLTVERAAAIEETVGVQESRGRVGDGLPERVISANDRNVRD
jgi:hypothetical protein